MRLFFACWPPASALPALHHHSERLHARLGGRVVPRARLHLTLAFLGDVDDARLVELTTLAARVAAASTAQSIAFDTLGGWDNGIGWLAPSAPPPGLIELAEHLNTALRDAGFLVERRRYRPHLTLLRSARRHWRSHPVAPLDWPLDHLALVESTMGPQGPSYVELARWPLSSAS